MGNAKNLKNINHAVVHRTGNIRRKLRDSELKMITEDRDQMS